MTDIYEQHKAAFKRVAAYIVLKDGERVATVAFKYPADGAGRLYCYLHIIGVPMARGYAGGCGYDKASAAAYDAIMKAQPNSAAEHIQWHVFHAPLKEGAGASNWDRALADAGFTVLQAV